MPEWFDDIKTFITNDYNEHPVRFTLEVISWIVSVGCTILLALTAPNPPWLLMYFLWIPQCAVFAWASWTRKSFGLMMNYLLFVVIDVIALIRLLLIHIK